MSKPDELTHHAASALVDTCPKCLQDAKTTDPACRSCGLLRGNFASFRDDSEGASSAAISNLWALVELQWTDLEAHDQFMVAVGRESAFALAARLYRAASRTRPGDPIAARQLERINRTVLAIHAVTARSRRDSLAPRSYKGVTALLVILFLGGAASLVAARGRMARHEPEAGEVSSSRARPQRDAFSAVASEAAKQSTESKQ